MSQSNFMDINYNEIDSHLRGWKQGDLIINGDIYCIHIADILRPLTNSSREVAKAQPTGGEHSSAKELYTIDSQEQGYVVVTQTCDIVKPCQVWQYITLCPLVEPDPDKFKQDDEKLEFVESVRRLERPAFAYIPKLANQYLVADLSRCFSVEKAVLLTISPIQGLENDKQEADFAEALARNRHRFAFPDSLSKALKKLKTRLKKKRGTRGEEGAHIDAIREIRVSANPSWRAQNIVLHFFLIIDNDPTNQNWTHYCNEWQNLIDCQSQYKLKAKDPFSVIRLEDLSAKDYLHSQHLDYDDLSSA